MLKKILYMLGVVLLLTFSNAQAAEINAAVVARIKAAAKRGDARGQCALAECYSGFDCEGIPHDYVRARQWYEKAAAQGDAEAQYNLGVMYDEGQGVRQNKRTAKEWFGKACDNGHQTGCDEYRKLNEAGF